MCNYFCKTNSWKRNFGAKLLVHFQSLNRCCQIAFKDLNPFSPQQRLSENACFLIHSPYLRESMFIIFIIFELNWHQPTLAYFSSPYWAYMWNDRTEAHWDCSASGYVGWYYMDLPGRWCRICLRVILTLSEEVRIFTYQFPTSQGY